MNSARFVGTIPGSAFGAPIVDAGDEQEQSPQTEARPDDPILALLAETRVGSDPEARQERSILLGERHELNLRTLDFLSRCHNKARAAFLEQHERVKAECRAAQKAVEDIKMKVIQLKQQLARASEASAHASAALRNAQQARASLGRYAVRTEIYRADALVRKAEAKLQQASAPEAEISQEINRVIFSDLHFATEKLKRLEAQERDLSLSLNPETVGSNSLGFVIR